MKRAMVFAILVMLAAFGAAAFYSTAFLWVFIVLAPLLVLAAWDLLQSKHSLLRNYPVFGHLRYLLEEGRHQIRQYFIEGDRDEVPFSRVQRNIVYQRAKGANDSIPFGKLINVYEPGHEWLEHSMTPLDLEESDLRVTVGNDQCTSPYSASRFNISAMSYGSLSSNAILALNLGAKLGGFYHDTGEGAISRYHVEHGGDLVWEIGTGYFGCRTKDGQFDPEQFEKSAKSNQVKMIELKMSQGAKPGGGGLLPGAKVTAEIAEARGIPVGEDCHSPAAHKEFKTPIEMLKFLKRLRDLSGGKPVGFKLCVGRRGQFLAVCKAMLSTGIHPDFVTVDGSEGGTGAAQPELTQSVGVALREGLIFVHNALIGVGLREKVKVICAGKVITGFDMAAKIAMGADICNSARGMMFALGCIQARACHKNICPTGITTHDPWRVHGLSVADKGPRVMRFHKETIEHLQLVLGACGLSDPEQLKPEMLWRRVTHLQTLNYRELYSYLQPGELLQGVTDERWQDWWSKAREDSFAVV
ncbi:MAG: FMN-binding glutamate synthase family protein [Woeseia sp.]|nr:FMN-binding glutamate synthase family protein [Woeseia sp.]MBT8096994.1 FMN-binding glutamate synthase family protein [Woeseia sp.]NNE59710.1 FMN-binding glutamate synthase family protein [Woeseia sp.]NNL54581.1 FMN-binding glutamate synthase family protein [Woeseia sp.]